MTVFVANTNILDLVGLKSEVEEVFLDAATVTVTIKDHLGNNVGGMSWPVTMEYILESDGDYRATLPHTLTLLHKKKYIAVIDANAGPDRIGHWEFPFKPLTRTGTDADDEE